MNRIFNFDPDTLGECLGRFIILVSFGVCAHYWPFEALTIAILVADKPIRI